MPAESSGFVPYNFAASSLVNVNSLPFGVISLPSIVKPRSASTIASNTSGLWPFCCAVARINPRIAEVIFSSTLFGNVATPSPGAITIGVAAPMTLPGAIKILSVAAAMYAPAEKAFGLT